MASSNSHDCESGDSPDTAYDQVKDLSGTVVKTWSKLNTNLGRCSIYKPFISNIDERPPHSLLYLMYLRRK